MKKPIRFNLQFQNGEGSVQIRNLDDLEENMNLNDLLDSFLSGDLERWLRQRDEHERANAIAGIAPNDEKETLLKLFDVLNLGFPESEIKDIVGRFIHQKAVAQARSMILASAEEIRELDVSISNDPQIKVFNISRFEKYKQLKEQIKSLDEIKLSAYKPLIKELTEDYADYFEIDCVNFYYEMYDADCPLPILALLMDSRWASFYNDLCFDYQRFVDDKCSQTLPINRNGIIIQQKMTCGERFYKAGYSCPHAFLRFWKIYDRDLSCLIDGVNNLHDNPDKPVKWIDRNMIPTAWKRLVPQEKKVMILHCGRNIEIEHDSIASKEIPFSYGLKYHRSDWRDFDEDNVLIFLPFD